MLHSRKFNSAKYIEKKNTVMGFKKRGRTDSPSGNRRNSTLDEGKMEREVET